MIEQSESGAALFLFAFRLLTLAECSSRAISIGVQVIFSISRRLVVSLRAFSIVQVSLDAKGVAKYFGSAHDCNLIRCRFKQGPIRVIFILNLPVYLLYQSTKCIFHSASTLS